MRWNNGCTVGLKRLAVHMPVIAAIFGSDYIYDPAIVDIRPLLCRFDYFL